jgi:hypothetical protein
MQDQSYDPYTNAQQQAYPIDQYNQQTAYNPDGSAYNYQPEYNGVGQGYDGYPPAAAGIAGVAALSGGGSHEGHNVNPVTGLADGMMVRVKVGFVRTLEDELGMSYPPFILPLSHMSQ